MAARWLGGCAGLAGWLAAVHSSSVSRATAVRTETSTGTVISVLIVDFAVPAAPLGLLSQHIHSSSVSRATAVPTTVYVLVDLVQ